MAPQLRKKPRKKIFDHANVTGKIRTKITFHRVWLNRSFFSLDPVPLGVRMTVILDKKPLPLKSFYFDLTWKQSLSQYYPFCMLFGIWYSGSILSHCPFCCKNHRKKQQHISFFGNVLLSPDWLPACFSRPWAHSRNSAMKPTCKMGQPAIDKKKYKTKPRLAGVSADPNPASRGMSLWFEQTNPFPGFRSAVKNTTRP